MLGPDIQPHPSRRGVYRLTTELIVPRPIDEVFAFYAEAANLEQITPPWLKFHVVTPAPIEMRHSAEFQTIVRC